MKILYVIPSYEPAWAGGGTVTATSELCRVLAAKGIDITVYTTDADGKGGHLSVPLNEPVKLGGVKVWYFHSDFGLGDFYSRSLARQLKETVKEFDLVHVSAIWQWHQLEVYKWCRKMNVPYMITPNGSFRTWSWNHNKIKKRVYWYLFGKKTLKNAVALHFTTQAEKREFLCSFPFFNNIPNFIIPNGISLDKKAKMKDIRKLLKIPCNTFLILFLGRIYREKGIEFILKALGKMKNDNFRFLIVGPAETGYGNFLKLLSRNLGIDKKVIWYGAVTKDEIWDFYYASDIMVLTSHSENFGMTVVEAMHCGIPVLISKNVGIWEEVVNDGAGIAVDLEVNIIVNELKKLLANPPLLKKMSENARRAVEDRYDINKVAFFMIKAYEDILTGRRSPELRWKVVDYHHLVRPTIKKARNHNEDCLHC